MPGKHQSETVKATIKAYHECGKTYSQIASIMNISKTSVGRIIRQSRDLPPSKVAPNKQTFGRKNKMSPTTIRIIRRQILKSPTKSAKEMKNENFKILDKVSPRTIQRTLFKKLGFPSRRAAKKNFLNTENARSALDFCSEIQGLDCRNVGKCII